MGKLISIEERSKTGSMRKCVKTPACRVSAEEVARKLLKKQLALELMASCSLEAGQDST